MTKHDIKLLIVNDDDLNCNTKTFTLDDIDLSSLGVSMLAIKNYDLIIYEGSRGSKILKSRYTTKGIIV